MVEIDDVSLIYQAQNGPVHALDHISFRIAKSETCAIIGPSGCGKTSMLFLIAGLRSPTSGTVLVGSRPAAGPRQDVALILQDYGLFPWKTVWQNAVLGLAIRGVPGDRQERIIEPILNQLGLLEFKNSFPSQLSGGQRQRLAVARALALQPCLLLMDEPLSALDALTREALQNTLLELWRANRFTMIMVTHSIEEAVFMGQRIAIFSDRPGRILTILDNPLAGNTAYRGEAQFHRQCNLIREVLGGGMIG